MPPNVNIHIRRILTDPVVCTAVILLLIASCLPMRHGFHPAELWFVVYAEGLILPSTVWARQVGRDLSLSGPRVAGVTILAWALPFSLYGFFAAPTWIVLGGENGSTRFATAGGVLFAVACVIVVAAVLLENRRRAATRVSRVRRT